MNKTELFKHLFAYFKIITVYIQYVFETMKYLKQHNSDYLFEMPKISVVKSS